jgi:hypothetical protein
MTTTADPKTAAADPETMRARLMTVSEENGDAVVPMQVLLPSRSATPGAEPLAAGGMAAMAVVADARSAPAPRAQSRLFLTLPRPKGGIIRTLDELKEHLQWAIKLEHCTIPPYLCALYSIKDGANPASAAILRSVVMEEMLHMALAANLLNAVGGTPRIDDPEFVPRYPTYLPMIDMAYKVSLLPFSQEAIDVFTRIELPDPHSVRLPDTDLYPTIGEFYKAIRAGIETVCGRDFHWDTTRQVTSESYYGAGGMLFAVTGRDKAIEAINEIVDQGEGSTDSIYDDDSQFGQSREPAHYYRYLQIREQRWLCPDDTPKTAPSGPHFAVDYSERAVYPMNPNPRAAQYPEGSEIRDRLDQFNALYTQLLGMLDAGFNGQPEQLERTVNIMYTLKYQAVALMRTPSTVAPGAVGPSFEYVPLPDRR